MSPGCLISWGNNGIESENSFGQVKQKEAFGICLKCFLMTCNGCIWVSCIFNPLESSAFWSGIPNVQLFM